MAGVSRRDVVLSGGFGTSSNSSRAGYLPICLARAPLDAFEGISVHIRTAGPSNASGKTQSASAAESFTLYCSPNIRFSDKHRERLISAGIKFVYIPIAEQLRFRQQTEATLLKTVDDPSISLSVKSEIVYETSVELVNELLTEPQLGAKSPRLEKVSRAVTSMVLRDQSAFGHLFAASHHDFYTATHMVNVATWMVPLAYAMGHQNPEELSQICQAGLLHDVGKVNIPPEVLNKKGRLSDAEWAMIRKHPEMGWDHLRKFEGIDPVILLVTRQHHERLDGSGYPDGLVGDQIHPISRICGVIDSFDAMTAFRPYKDRTMSVAEALSIIVGESPSKYDEGVVKAWLGLLDAAQSQGLVGEPIRQTGSDGKNHREFPRFTIDCKGILHILQPRAEQWQEGPPIQVTAHNISRSGVGLISPTELPSGERVRLYLQGSASLNRTDEGLVVRCRAYRDGWFEAGIKFASLAQELNPTLSATTAA